MKVYTLVKESYSYWDSDYNVSLKVFKDKQSAMNYLEIEKESLLQDAMKQLDVTTIEEIQALYDEEDGVYYFENSKDSYYIEIEEWGHDCLSIEEHDVMEFSM